LPCTEHDIIRLSLDVRYQPLNEEIEARSLAPHCNLTWEEIYAGWKSDDLKYYWKDLPLKFAPWDETLLQPSAPHLLSAAMPWRTKRRSRWHL